MKKKRPVNAKQEALKKGGTLHSRSEDVIDEVFQQGDFFDPRDLLQVKYEMLRRVRVDGLAVAQAARAFGFSRPSYYKAHRAFEQSGLHGLLPAKKGPRRSHKLSAVVMAFVARQRDQDPKLGTLELVDRIADEFGVAVHPRSLERAILRARKKH